MFNRIVLQKTTKIEPSIHSFLDLKNLLRLERKKRKDDDMSHFCFFLLHFHFFVETVFVRESGSGVDTLLTFPKV